MYIAILGRQPELGIAELERVFGDVRWFSEQSAAVNTTAMDIERLGGTLKAGRVVAELHGDWRRASMQLVKAYTAAWSDSDAKLTLGISAYGFDVSPRDVQKTGIILKSKLKEKGVSLRLIPNSEPALNTATSHHNKLGLSNSKIELIIVRNKSGKIVIAESIGAQNITALARRDQGRPKRDAFVGMLPPKLAQIMINLAVGSGATPQNHDNDKVAYSNNGDSASTNAEIPQPALPNKNASTSVEASSTSFSQGDVPTRASQAPQADVPSPVERPLAKNDVELADHNDTGNHTLTVLDPFCGTGVLLQETLLLGHNAYGTDLSDKMIDYSQTNLQWIKTISHTTGEFKVQQGDAMTTIWDQPIDAIACEGYLGQPFSAPPSPSKLVEVRGNCNHIMGMFLKNIAPQLQPGTPLCVAIPAWRSSDGSFTHLPLINNLDQFGFKRIELKNVRATDLLYYREDQVVARELLVLTKI